MRKIIRKSFNPHWIGDVHTRDYQIDNILIRDISDDYVLMKTKFRGGYGFAEGNVEEFLNSYKINVKLREEEVG